MSRKNTIKFKKLLAVGLSLVLTLSLGIFAARSWRDMVVARMEREEYARVTQLIEDGKAKEALALIDEQVRSDARLPWSMLELDAMAAARHIPRLVSLYRRTPQRVLAHEEASLLVARACQAAGQPDEFASIREGWRGHELHVELWLALDSDMLGLAGKTREAEQLLKSKKFNGEAEAVRLVRLALYVAKRDLYESWRLLDQAYLLSPRSPEIRSFRAQILESIGRNGEARAEYVAALVADPKNPLLRDQLAEFYRRQGSYDLALQTWREALPMNPPDFIVLKEAFWSRVIQPTEKQQISAETQGALVPLISFIKSLPQNRFWDADAYNRLVENHRLAQQRPEVYWLQLLELLRAGKEQEAAELLRESRFQTRSFSPGLEAGLAQLLRFRAGQSTAAEATQLKNGSSERHPLWLELARKTPEPGMAAFLKGHDAFGAAFMTAGWREDALQLSAPQADKNVPGWFVYGLAQSLRFNRGPQEALAYLPEASQVPELRLLRGELLMGGKRVAEGKAELTALARLDSPAAYRAAWVLAQAAVETGELANAKSLIQGQSQIKSSTAGKELLARISLLEGKTAEAEKQYRAIAEDSVEAKTYLARRAFEKKDWPVARKFTEELIRTLPDQLQLRENLLAISKPEALNEKR